MSLLPGFCLDVTPSAIDEPSRHCKRLWVEVVNRALLDAVSAGGGYRGQDRISARAWLSRPSYDRAMVLSFAGIDPGAFASRSLPRLLQQWEKFDAGERPHRSYRVRVKNADYEVAA